MRFVFAKTVEAMARDDSGSVQGWKPAGVITVLPKPTMEAKKIANNASCKLTSKAGAAFWEDHPSAAPVAYIHPEEENVEKIPHVDPKTLFAGDSDNHRATVPREENSTS